MLQYIDWKEELHQVRMENKILNKKVTLLTHQFRALEYHHSGKASVNKERDQASPSAKKRKIGEDLNGNAFMANFNSSYEDDESSKIHKGITVSNISTFYHPVQDSDTRLVTIL